MKKIFALTAALLLSATVAFAGSTLVVDKLHAIATGGIPGHSVVNKFGANPDVGTTIETVWEEGGVYAYPASAIAMEIVSDDVNDDDGSTGAETVTVYGLDANYNEQSETVTLDGTTPVALVNTYLRVYRMKVRSAGATGANEGKIEVQNTANTVTYCSITAGNNQSLAAFWTVPAGKTAYLCTADMSTDSNKGLQTFIFVRPYGEVFQLKQPFHLYGGVAHFEYKMPLVIPEKSDIEIRAIAAATGGSANAAFSLYYK